MQQPTIDASRSATRVSVSFAFSVALHVSLLAFAMMGPTKEAKLTTPAREVGEHLEYALVLPSPDEPPPPPEVERSCILGTGGGRWRAAGGRPRWSVEDQ